MKKFYQIFISIIFSFLMISCSNLYQDLTTTTVEFTKESIASIKSRTSGSDENCVIFATVTCGKKTQTKTVDIAEVREANGVTLQFDKLPVGKTGTLYVSVGSKKVKSELETYYSENIAELDGKTQFRVQPNGNTKIKVSLKENEEKIFAQFLTFPYDEESPISNIELNFTEYSTITAPLPVGTTRWQIYHDDMGNITYLGDFGEKIDVHNELMKYNEYAIYESGFNSSNPNEPLSIANYYFEATGEPTDKIITPIVFSEQDDNDNTLYALNSLNGTKTEIFSMPPEIEEYCFDNAGNLYFIYNYENITGKICKIAYNHKEGKYEALSEEPFWFSDNPTASSYFDTVTYDPVQNVLYGVIYNSSDGQIILTKFSNPAGSIYKDTYIGARPVISLNKSIFDNLIYYKLSVYNGILYAAGISINEETNTYKLQLRYFDLSNQNAEINTVEMDLISNTNTNLEFNLDTTYQDNNIYIIFSCYSEYRNLDYTNYSTGGIVKYNLKTNSFDRNFNIKGMATSKTNEVGLNPPTKYTHFSPTKDSENTEFYGPTKIVAIMPKKLVFIDKGADISSYETENGKNIPTKSRIVEYNLSSNTFSSIDVETSDLGFEFSFSIY